MGHLPPKALPPSDLTHTCATLLAGTHPNCTENGAWCQTTGCKSKDTTEHLIFQPVSKISLRADTSVMPLDKDRSQFVMTYDRLANGWGGPP